jgi:hypothetical protein
MEKAGIHMRAMARGDFEKAGIHMEAMPRADVKTGFGGELRLGFQGRVGFGLGLGSGLGTTACHARLHENGGTSLTGVAAQESDGGSASAKANISFDFPGRLAASKDVKQRGLACRAGKDGSASHCVV